MNFDVWGSGIVDFLNSSSENDTQQGTLASIVTPTGT